MPNFTASFKAPLQWRAQYAIQRGRGFKGLKGFTDQLPRDGDWFKCRIRTSSWLGSSNPELAETARAIELWLTTPVETVAISGLERTDNGLVARRQVNLIQSPRAEIL